MFEKLLNYIRCGRIRPRILVSSILPLLVILACLILPFANANVGNGLGKWEICDLPDDTNSDVHPSDYCCTQNACDLMGKKCCEGLIHFNKNCSSLSKCDPYKMIKEFREELKEYQNQHDETTFWRAFCYVLIAVSLMLFIVCCSQWVYCRRIKIEKDKLERKIAEFEE